MKIIIDKFFKEVSELKFLNFSCGDTKFHSNCFHEKLSNSSHKLIKDWLIGMLLRFRLSLQLFNNKTLTRLLSKVKSKVDGIVGHISPPLSDSLAKFLS